MQPAKMTHMTSTARQTNVIVNPIRRRSRPTGARPAEGSRTLALRVNSPTGLSALETYYAGLNALPQ